MCRLPQADPHPDLCRLPSLPPGRLWRGAVPVALGAVLAWVASVSAADPGVDFFEKKIRPVLVEHCYQCHSVAAQKQKGGLVLDSRDALRKGGDSGPAVVPGKPLESLLLKAVRYTEEELRMPPKGKLPEATIADLEKWVALGAPDPRIVGQASSLPKGSGQTGSLPHSHWAFQAPRRQPTPHVTDASWPRGTIDRFLLAKLEAKGLQPAPDTDRATLLRRAHFDLIGLPPTPEQLAAFLADPSPAAFAKVIDQLLASPHFGERWGRHWLDVARFAESSGGGRSLLLKEAWRYRDYVIASFNADKPYNRFVAEQVAGDLLPSSSAEQRRQQLVATAFLVLGPTNYERQDKDILETDVIDEQLDTLGKAFLGLTIGCARCHDHKFDPIPTREYYALAGILRSTRTLIHDNVSRWVEQPLPLSPEQEAVVRPHEAAVAALQEKIKQVKEAEKKAGKTSATASGPLAVRDLPGIVVDDTQAKQVGPWRHSRYSNNYIGAGYLYDDRGVQTEKTLTFVPEFARGGRYEVRLAYIPHTNRAEKVPVRIFHADGEHTVYINQRETPPIDGRFVALGQFRFEPGSQWFVMLSTEGAKGHVVADAVQFLPEELAEAKTLAAERPRATGKAAAAPTSIQLEAELKKLLAKGPARPMAVSVKDADKIEDFFVCIRGNIQNRGDKVARGFLHVATVGQPPVIPAKESGRRELAMWLTHPDNPLTARVMVNRIWHALFGAGLVRTVDNFGATGERPSHPELLDYLALRFVQEGWSVKQLIREIMLSRTYQLSSTGQTAALAADPENRLLGRMNRRRLDAEAIRDAMLAVSGQLDRTLGGPTIRKGTVSEYGYTFDDRRRSVYTPVFRNRLLELFEVFDFADPNLVMGRRNVSTVATQALYLMNNPFVMEQARHAAQAALAVPGLDDTGRVDRAYQVALGRLPTERERQLALRVIAASGEEASREGRLAAWERFYQALLACIDFRYVN